MSYEQLRMLMEHGEELGCVNMSAFTLLIQELELDEEEVAGLYATLEERGVEVTDDCALPDLDETTYETTQVAANGDTSSRPTRPALRR